MKKCLLLFVVFSMCQTASAQKGDTGIFINPATIDFSLNQGQTGAQRITIINKMPVKKQFKLYVSDWVRDTIGEHEYKPAGSIKQSCARWVVLEKDFVELLPNQYITVNVRLQIPDSADAVKMMRWAMVFVETIEEAKAPDVTKKITTIVTTLYRVGVHIYQTPPSVLTRELVMESFEPLKNNRDSIYRITCQNTGQVQLRCKSYIELTNLTDGKKTVINAEEFPMFPEQKRYVDFVIPSSLPKGKYNVIAAVDAGYDLPLEAAQKVIEIK
ncbi:MAG: hypothetical protein K2X48_16325 [Chitinophagaceae bacterium]|nr:hypothetical protein [Chitinophagaceae bacterium]